MNTTGIFIDRDELQGWPEALRNTVLARVFGVEQKGQLGPTTEAEAALSAEVEDEHFAQLTPNQARQFIAGCGAKTKLAVSVMAKSDSRFFNLRDVSAALNEPVPDMAGVWAGLTRRIRTITGDPKATLIYWNDEAIHDRKGNYIDHRGELTEATYASFRKALGL